ncbi:twin-arginine translocation signal domain-containing protein, partial [Niveispirillum sp.]|nr:twin-arginine translocation signal domain-containing protein [Niveispirillum sp.]
MSRLEPPPSRRDFLIRSAALAPAAALGAGMAHAQETAK